MQNVILIEYDHQETTSQAWRTSHGYRIQRSSNLEKGTVTNPGGYLDGPPQRNLEKDPVTNPGDISNFHYLDFCFKVLDIVDLGQTSTKEAFRSDLDILRFLFMLKSAEQEIYAADNY